jgi:hypothetical protein
LDLRAALRTRLPKSAMNGHAAAKGSHSFWKSFDYLGLQLLGPFLQDSLRRGE